MRLRHRFRRILRWRRFRHVHRARRILKFRRIFKWIGTLACLLILLGAAACIRWQDMRFAVHHWRAAGRHWSVTIKSGAIAWGFWSAPPNADGSNDTRVGVEIARRRGTWGELIDDWSYLGLHPKYSFSNGEGFVTMPLWIVLCVFAIPTAVLWRIDRRRAPAGCCGKCGYDLTGNVSGRCPECGTASGA